MSPSKTPITMGTHDVLVRVDDYFYPTGWANSSGAAARSRQCCADLEAGKVLCFERTPYLFPREDQEFLLSQKQSDSRLHKNVSYRPAQDILRGAAGDALEITRIHDIMRKYSREVAAFIKQLLAPYAPEIALDYASFRPEEEQNRNLPIHKRNDLLHFDSFPTRPMHGRRILRCFTNINPNRARVWNTTEDFTRLAEKYADKAGLAGFAAKGSPKANPLVKSIKKAFGLKAVDHSAYDRFMLRFHDYLKENSDFQEKCAKTRLEFQPGWTWICYTDSVAHAVLSGQFALEQTFIISVNSLVTPEKAPIRILEKLAGKPLARAA
jgi:hypothetical protein